jgi:transcription elongation factor GreB
MSKAFAGESDDEGQIPDGPALPPGVRNYMTASGAARLRADVQRLADERRRLASGVQAQAHSQKIERQLRYWVPRLEALEVIDPRTQPSGRVLFGATVEVTAEKGRRETWRIVGIDETDPDKGWISWMSPLAEALLDKRPGDTVAFMDHCLTVKRISYEA